MKMGSVYRYEHVWWAVELITSRETTSALFVDTRLEMECSLAVSDADTAVIFLHHDTGANNKNTNHAAVAFHIDICADELQTLSLFYKILPLIQEKYPYETA